MSDEAFHVVRNAWPTYRSRFRLQKLKPVSRQFANWRPLLSLSIGDQIHEYSVLIGLLLIFRKLLGRHCRRFAKIDWQRIGGFGSHFLIRRLFAGNYISAD